MAGRIEWLQCCLHKFFFVTFKFAFILSKVLVLTWDTPVLLSIILTQQHINISQVSNINLNLKNVTKRRHNLYRQYFASKLIQKCIDLLSQANSCPVLNWYTTNMKCTSFKPLVVLHQQTLLVLMPVRCLCHPPNVLYTVYS